MAIEMLVGLNVIDDEKYTGYRDAIAPLIKAHQGGFSFDCRVSSVLKSPTEAPINRVFTIFFADRDLMTAFFRSEEYLKIKRDWFEAAVEHTTIIAEYECS